MNIATKMQSMPKKYVMHNNKLIERVINTNPEYCYECYFLFLKDECFAIAGRCKDEKHDYIYQCCDKEIIEV